MYRNFFTFTIATLMGANCVSEAARAQAQMERVPGENNGYFFKIASDDAIWMIDQGKRRHVHAGAWKALFNSSAGVAQISSDQLATFPVGQPIENESYLAKCKPGSQALTIEAAMAKTPHVYWIDGRKRRRIENIEAFRDHQFSEATIRMLDAAELGEYNYDHRDEVRAVAKSV